MMAERWGVNSSVNMSVLATSRLVRMSFDFLLSFEMKMRVKGNKAIAIIDSVRIRAGSDNPIAVRLSAVFSLCFGLF